MALVSGDDRVGRAQPHFVHRQIFAAFGDHGVDGNFRRRTNRPALHNRMRIDDLCAQQFDGAQIVQRFRIDLHRRKSLASIFIDDQRTVLQRNWPEEPCHRIAHGIDFPGRDLEAIDVGNAGVIGGRIKIPPVRRKHAALRYRAAQSHRRDFVDVTRQKIGGAINADPLIAIDLANGCREQRSVRRNVQIEQAMAIFERDELVPYIVRRPGFAPAYPSHSNAGCPKACDRRD